MLEPSSSSPDPDLSHRDALPFGTQLGEFEVQSLIGVGGFGMVYRAWDHSLRRAVAIKEFMPTGLAGRDKGATVALRSSADNHSFYAGLRSFVAEAQLLAQFDHPSLVKVFRIWEANNTAYMVMPLYAGVTLKQARDGMAVPPSEAWLRQVLWSLTEALKVLHDANTMHRDVSPDNIFLQDKGPPVLLDLGAARRAIQDYTHKHTAILKVNYAPIEQYADVKDMRQGPWTDLYALAAVVHGCVSNQAPPPATFRVLEDHMVPFAGVARAALAQFDLAYSPEFVSAIQAALAVRPEQRPQSIQAFTQALRLQPGVGMAEFDWRKELGPGGWAGNASPGPLKLNPDVSLPTTGPSDDVSLPNSFAGSDRTVRSDRFSAPELSEWAPTDLDNGPAPAEATPSATATGTTRRVLAVLAFLTLAVIAATVWRLLAPSADNKAGASDAMPVVVKLAPPTPVVPKPEATPVSAAPAPSQLVSRPVLPKKPDPAARPGAVHTADTPVAAPVTGPAPVPSPAPEPVRTSVPTPAPVAAPTSRAPATVGEPCADANLFTRPMCLHNECQKPAFARLQVCQDLPK